MVCLTPEIAAVAVFRLKFKRDEDEVAIDSADSFEFLMIFELVETLKLIAKAV